MGEYEIININNLPTRRNLLHHSKTGVESKKFQEGLTATAAESKLSFPDCPRYFNKIPAPRE